MDSKELWVVKKQRRVHPNLYWKPQSQLCFFTMKRESIEQKNSPAPHDNTDCQSTKKMAYIVQHFLIKITCGYCTIRCPFLPLVLHKLRIPTNKSPSLQSSYYLFDYLKKKTLQDCFRHDFDLNEAVQVHLENKHKDFFLKGIVLLIKHCKKSTEVRGY